MAAPAAGIGSGNQTKVDWIASSSAANTGWLETSWSSPFIVERQSWLQSLIGVVPWLILGVAAWKLRR